MSFRLAGDQDAIDAAASDFAKNFKAQDLWKPLPMFVGTIVALGLVGDWWWGLAFWLLPYLTWLQRSQLAGLPRNTFRSTSLAIPGTLPVPLYCQKLHPAPG